LLDAKVKGCGVSIWTSVSFGLTLSFKQRKIRLERRVEINYDLNLIFKIRSLQTIGRFFKIRSHNFSRKSWL
jgi:hypothetical protein